MLNKNFAACKDYSFYILILFFQLKSATNHRAYCKCSRISIDNYLAAFLKAQRTDL